MILIHRLRFSLRQRLLLLVLVAVLPVVGLVLTTAWEQRRLAAESAGEDARWVVRLASGTHERLVEGARSLLVGLAQLSDVQMHHARTCSAHFAQIARQFPLYRDVGAIRPDGVVFCTGREVSAAARPPDRSTYERARAARSFAASGYRPDGSGLPVLTLTYPAVDRAGSVWAAVFVELDLGWLDELARGASLPPGSVLMVADATGLVLRRHPHDPGSGAGGRIPESPLLEALRSGGADRLVETAEIDGVERLYAVARLAGPALPEPVYAIAGSPKRAAQGPADRLLVRNLLWAGLVLLLALGATAVVSDLFILRRLKRVVVAAERLTGGDLTARVAVQGGDEIAIMARAFNAMAERLAERAGEDQSARDALADRVGNLHLLNRMGGLLQTCPTLDAAYRVIGSMVPQLFPRETGALFAMSGARDALEARATWGTGSPRPTAFGPEACWALRNGRAYAVPDTRAGLLCTHLSTPPPRAYVCAPLVAQGEILGMLHVGSAAGWPPPGTDDARSQLIEAVAAQLALSLANVRLREVLRNQSIRDPLTGLFNRRYLEETLEREVRRAGRAGQSLALLLLDVDGFKRQNDTFGHDAGDAVLRELGSLLARSLRREDVACRYGGDEFVLVLPDTALETASRRAEEIRVAVKALPLAAPGSALGSITVSIGLAAMPDHGLDRDTLLAAADAALYRAKREGRDRVCLVPGAREAEQAPERPAG